MSVWSSGARVPDHATVALGSVMTGRQSDRVVVGGDGDHRSGFGPDRAIEVDFQEAIVFQFEEALAEVFFAGLIDEIVECVPVYGRSPFGAGLFNWL